jgi:hypothetical protein
MTPIQTIVIDARELNELELRCECGSSIHIPIPPQKPLPQQQQCVGCGRHMWLDNTVRGKIAAVVDSLADWAAAGYTTLAIKFVLTQKA